MHKTSDETKDVEVIKSVLVLRLDHPLRFGVDLNEDRHFGVVTNSALTCNDVIRSIRVWLYMWLCGIAVRLTNVAAHFVEVGCREEGIVCSEHIIGCC